tara:strand:+ start:905 stop:1186 length:282 start_codon:yes stop_codon:yes gene_type:complete
MESKIVKINLELEFTRTGEDNLSITSEVAKELKKRLQNLGMKGYSKTLVEKPKFNFEFFDEYVHPTKYMNDEEKKEHEKGIGKIEIDIARVKK